jgi:protein-tyrosine-phosphatase
LNDTAASGAAVLLVCTGNQCRSPMAAALLRAGLEERHTPLRVVSAGLVSEGMPAPPEAQQAMRSLGLDLSRHRSRLVTPAMVAGADLVLGMTRQHVMDLAVMAPGHWDRCFTLVDALHRAEAAGQRRATEGLRDWAARLHAGRARSSLLSLPFSEDVADPIGGALRDYERTRDELARLISRLAGLLSPGGHRQDGD